MYPCLLSGSVHRDEQRLLCIIIYTKQNKTKQKYPNQQRFLCKGGLLIKFNDLHIFWLLASALKMKFSVCPKNNGFAQLGGCSPLARTPMQIKLFTHLTAANFIISEVNLWVSKRRIEHDIAVVIVGVATPKPRSKRCFLSTTSTAIAPWTMQSCVRWHPTSRIRRYRHNHLMVN